MLTYPLECLLERGEKHLDHHNADNCRQLTIHTSCRQHVEGGTDARVWYLLHHSAVKNVQCSHLLIYAVPSECFSEAQDSVFWLTGLFIWLYQRKLYPTWNQIKSVRTSHCIKLGPENLKSRTPHATSSRGMWVISAKLTQSSGIYPGSPAGKNYREYLSHEKHLCLGGHRGRKRRKTSGWIWSLSNIIILLSDCCLFEMPELNQPANDASMTERCQR